MLLTFKIHSSGFIRWSEVARAPKTNRGLRSGISDGQVPRTHHSVGHTKGDNRGREPDLLLATLSVQHLIIKEVITQIKEEAKNTLIKTFPFFNSKESWACYSMYEHNVSHLDNLAVYFIFILAEYNDFCMHCFWKVGVFGNVVKFCSFFFFSREQLRS